MATRTVSARRAFDATDVADVHDSARSAGPHSNRRGAPDAPERSPCGGSGTDERDGERSNRSDGRTRPSPPDLPAAGVRVELQKTHGNDAHHPMQNLFY